MGTQGDNHLAAEPAYLHLCGDLLRNDPDGGVGIRMGSLFYEALAAVLRSGLCPNVFLRQLQPDAQKRLPDALSYRPRPQAGAGDEWGCCAWTNNGTRWPHHSSGA